MKNGYQKGMIAGAIAGVIMGITVTPLYFISVLIGISEILVSETVWDLSMYTLTVVAHISLGLIWGIIFGLLYSKYYECTPGKGIMKGLYFGLIIWMVKDLAAGSYTAFILQEATTAKFLIYYGFFMWIIYGVVLGFLYKKSD